MSDYGVDTTTKILDYILIDVNPEVRMAYRQSQGKVESLFSSIGMKGNVDWSIIENIYFHYAGHYYTFQYIERGKPFNYVHAELRQNPTWTPYAQIVGNCERFKLSGSQNVIPVCEYNSGEVVEYLNEPDANNVIARVYDKKSNELIKEVQRTSGLVDFYEYPDVKINITIDIPDNNIIYGKVEDELDLARENNLIYTLTDTSGIGNRIIPFKGWEHYN